MIECVCFFKASCRTKWPRARSDGQIGRPSSTQRIHPQGAAQPFASKPNIFGECSSTSKRFHPISEWCSFPSQLVRYSDNDPGRRKLLSSAWTRGPVFARVCQTGKGKISMTVFLILATYWRQLTINTFWFPFRRIPSWSLLRVQRIKLLSINQFEVNFGQVIY